MKRTLSRALLFLIFAVSIHAQSITRHTVDRATGTVVGHAEAGEIIIELKAQPVMARGSVTSASQIGALLDRLESDVASFDHRRVAATATTTLTHRYTEFFAGASAHVSSDAVERIRGLDYVRAVHPDNVVHSFLTDSTKQIGATEFWERHGVRGAGAVVAIIDTGIDYRHPAFGGAFGPGKKVKGGRDFVNNDSDPMDDNGHGTHVAGIVAGNGGGVIGVAPDATLLAYKVLDSSGSGRDSAVLSAIEEVARTAPDVVNMSLGRPATPDDPVVRAIENATLSSGVLFCVAAGNTGHFLDIGSPGGAPNAITVGAVDKQGRLASFSTRGPVVPTGAIKPEVVAPGVDIVSARNGGGFRTASGTSMASPHVAGVAALLVSLHPEWSVQTLRSAIINGARGLDAEVMAAGAGLVYAVDAAGNVVEPSMQTVSFGVSDQTKNPWTASNGFIIKNRSNTKQSFTLAVDGLRDGIDVVPSQTSFDLEPGASTRLDLALSLDQNQIPSPVAGSLSYSGFLRFTGDGVSFAVPWSFVKASRVRVKWSAPGTADVKIGTEKMMVSGAATSANQPIDLFVGAGAASLWLQGRGSGSTVYHIIRENLDLTQPDITLGAADAPYRIQFAGADAFGRALADRGDRSSREMVIVHPHFASNLLDAIAYVDRREQVYASLPPSARLLTFERAFDSNPLVTWAGQYPPLAGVSEDLTLTFPEGSWKEMAADADIPAELTNAYQNTSAGFWIRGEHQIVGSIARPQQDASPLDTKVHAWMTATSQNDSGTSLLVEIGGGSATTPLPTTEVMAEYKAVDGGIVAGGQTGTRISAGVIPSGQPFTIGDGPSHPTASVGLFEGTMFATIGWEGAQGEQRLYDVKRMTAKLLDASGAVISTGDSTPMPGIPGLRAPVFQMMTPLPSPGVYTLEASTNSFEVAGSPARGTLRLAFDSANATDAVPPVLTSMRITDGDGRPTTRLTNARNATMTFSAFDVSATGYSDANASRVVVQYRPHGAGDESWLPLATTAIADDISTPRSGFFLPPDGVLYRVALGNTAMYQGALDVRINVEDAAGNAMSYVVEPAFVISPGKRRAAHP